MRETNKKHTLKKCTRKFKVLNIMQVWGLSGVLQRKRQLMLLRRQFRLSSFSTLNQLPLLFSASSIQTVQDRALRIVSDPLCSLHPHPIITQVLPGSSALVSTFLRSVLSTSSSMSFRVPGRTCIRILFYQSLSDPR